MLSFAGPAPETACPPLGCSDKEIEEAIQQGPHLQREILKEERKRIPLWQFRIHQKDPSTAQKESTGGLDEALLHHGGVWRCITKVTECMLGLNIDPLCKASTCSGVWHAQQSHVQAACTWPFLHTLLLPIIKIARSRL
jgi:hypothetical protein